MRHIARLGWLRRRPSGVWPTLGGRQIRKRGISCTAALTRRIWRAADTMHRHGARHSVRPGIPQTPTSTRTTIWCLMEQSTRGTHTRSSGPTWTTTPWSPSRPAMVSSCGCLAMGRRTVRCSSSRMDACSSTVLSRKSGLRLSGSLGRCSPRRKSPRRTPKTTSSMPAKLLRWAFSSSPAKRPWRMLPSLHRGCTTTLPTGSNSRSIGSKHCREVSKRTLSSSRAEAHRGPSGALTRR
mmetsp:Transcript_9712/g.26388  ORF Transcript_9712/g.26388 Transcript_9712/m.26388 type:complete len:238 (+) Transcript_9712:957-1670(+)